MRTKQCSLLSKFLLGMSLAFSLSGCSSRFANLYVGYGITRTSYPKPTEQTCFHNHEIFLDEQGGLQRYEVRQIIENEQTPQETAQVMNNNAQQIFSYGNTKPAEAFYSHIEPKALGQFMLGCAKIAAQTGNHMRTLQASILDKMAKWALYLHNTQPPKPTYFPNSQTGTCSVKYAYSHPAVNMAVNDLIGLNLLQPIIYASTHHLWTWQAPVQSEKDVLNQLQQNNDLYQQAIAEADNNANYTGLIVIVSQWLPKNWRDYKVGCYVLGQKLQAKGKAARTGALARLSTDSP